MFVKKKLFIAFAAVLAVAALVAAGWLLFPAFHKQNPRLTTPMLAVDAISAKSLYFNAAARPWLISRRSDLLTPDDRNEHSDRIRGFIQAVQNPKLFRQLDRRYRFDTLLLTGDPSQFRPLLEHLLETKDWTLVYLDHTSLIYKRETTRAWLPADLESIRVTFASPREQAIFLAQAATKMLALRMQEAAKDLLETATRLDPKIPEIANALAIYHMNRGEWAAALADANRALALDKKSMAALATKTQILYSTGKLDEALGLSSKLIATRPNDPGLLFYHARIAHDCRAFRQEIDALEKLIGLADREARPTAGYRIYLAQAYAADGQARPSIDQFTKVLAEPDLSPEQRAFAQETLAQVKSRSGL